VSALHSTALFAHTSAQSTRAQRFLPPVRLLPLFKLVPSLLRPLRALQEFLPPRSALTPTVKRSTTTSSAVNLIRASAHTQAPMPLTLTWIVCLPVTPQPLLAVSHSLTLAVLKAVDPAHATSRTAREASPLPAGTTLSLVWLPPPSLHRLLAQLRVDRPPPR
jgi:hypothetical protein